MYARSIGSEQFLRTVRGPSVNHPVFDISIILRKHTLDGLLERSGSIETYSNDGYFHLLGLKTKDIKFPSIAYFEHYNIFFFEDLTKIYFSVPLQTQFDSKSDFN